MYGQTGFDTILMKSGIVRSDFRMTDDFITDDVIGYDVITKMMELASSVLKRGWTVRR